MAGRKKKVPVESSSPALGRSKILDEIAHGLLSHNTLKKRLCADPIFRDESDILTVDDLPALFICSQASPKVLTGIPMKLVQCPAPLAGETTLDSKYHPTWFPPYVEYVAHSRHGNVILENHYTRSLPHIPSGKEDLQLSAYHALTWALSNIESAHPMVTQYIQTHATIDDDQLHKELYDPKISHLRRHGALDNLFKEWANRGLLLALSNTKTAESTCRKLLEIQFKLLDNVYAHDPVHRSLRDNDVLSRWAITETIVDLGEWKNKLADNRANETALSIAGLGKALKEINLNEDAVWVLAKHAVTLLCLDETFRSQWTHDAATKGRAMIERFNAAGIALEKSVVRKTAERIIDESSFQRSNESVLEGWYFVTELAKKHNVNRDALRKRIYRAKKAKKIETIPNENRSSREEEFRYRERDALPYIEEIKLNRQKKSGGRA